MGEYVLRVKEKRRAHPRRAYKKREGNRDEFHREAQRLLLYLRQRLKERDENADERGDGNRDQRKPQYDYKAHLRIVENLRVAHSIYPLTSPWMRSVQPFTITKRSSLNGSEIVTGETIIMPIARRMFDTIMSIAMNGR